MSNDPAGQGSICTVSRSSMPRRRMAACHSGFSFRAMMARSDSSNSRPGRIPSTSTNDRTSPLVTDTTISMTCASGPATMIVRTSRSTGVAGGEAPDTGLRRLLETHIGKAPAVGEAGVAADDATAALISGAVSASSGCPGTCRYSHCHRCSSSGPARGPGNVRDKTGYHRPRYVGRPRHGKNHPDLARPGGTPRRRRWRPL